MDWKTLTSKIKRIFKGRKKKIVIFALLVIFIGGIVAVNNYDSTPYAKEAKKLMKYKVIKAEFNKDLEKIVDNLEYGDYKISVDGGSNESPYVEVVYDFENYDLPYELVKKNLRENAAIIFALAEYPDYVKFDISNIYETSSDYTITFNRHDINGWLSKDCSEFGKNSKTLKELIELFSNETRFYPQKYSLKMTTSPGIKISEFFVKENKESNDKGNNYFLYSCEYGSIYTEDSEGVITEKGKNFKFGYGKDYEGEDIYWNPRTNGDIDRTFEKNIINLQLLNKNDEVLAEKKIFIYLQDGIYTASDEIYFNDSFHKKKNDFIMEIYHFSKDGQSKELITIINDDDLEKNSLLASIQNSSKVSKSFNEVYDYEIVSYEKGNVSKRLSLNSDNGMMMYEDDKEYSYEMNKKSLDTLMQIIGNRRMDSNIINEMTFRGLVKKIEDKREGYKLIQLEDKASGSSIEVTDKDILKFNIKIGDNLEINTIRRNSMFKVKEVKLLD